jgi:DNA-binding beta-propeller fold protein YncE
MKNFRRHLLPFGLALCLGLELICVAAAPAGLLVSDSDQGMVLGSGPESKATKTIGQHFNSKISEHFSPIDIVHRPTTRELIIAGHTGQALLFFDMNSETVNGQLDLGLAINDMTVSADGKILYVTAGTAPGTLIQVDLDMREVKGHKQLGHHPCAPVIHAQLGVLYVADRFNHNILVLDLKTLMPLKSIPVEREPISLCLSVDGEDLYVSNHLPNMRADDGYVACQVSVIDTNNHKVGKTISLVNGATITRDIDVSPDGQYVFVGHLVARFNVPTTHLDRGWINTNGLSIISAKDHKLLYTILLDDVNRGFANPWAITVSPDSQLLSVSAAGGQELRLIDLQRMSKKVQDYAATSKSLPEHLNVHNDLSFISDFSQRLPLGGNGPRSMVQVDQHLYIAEYFSNSLSIVELDEVDHPVDVRYLALQKQVELTPERLGEQHFNDASFCFQNWLSCASCHSNDARTDGLNWDLLNDGIGNSKNAKNLLYAHFTPPSMATGIRANANVAVRAGLRYIQFTVRPEDDAKALDAYLSSLVAVPSPMLVNGELSKKALFGKKVFEQQDCTDCHHGTYFTNKRSYNIGTGLRQDAEKKFDVPMLREVWRSAPYLHDGRANTVYQLLKEHDHGESSHLSEKELTALVEYVMSL